MAITEIELTPAVAVLRRMAEATGSPHYGGIDPDEVGEDGFSLPGGGMSAVTRGTSTVRITIYSRFDVVRCWTDLYCCMDGTVVRGHPTFIDGSAAWPAEVEPTVQDGSYAYHTDIPPRRRDVARLAMWVDIAAGVDPHVAVSSRGLGNNIGHAHAGFPAELDDVDPITAALIAARRSWRERKEDLDYIGILQWMLNEIDNLGYSLPWVDDMLARAFFESQDREALAMKCLASMGMG